MLFNKKDKLANYTVKFQHKKGSYAETYRVKDNIGKSRFLKLIDRGKLNHNQTDNDGNIIEIEISSVLKHHNLCSMIEHGELILDNSKYAYFVTEFVSGETLSNWVVRKGRPMVYLIKKIAKAVLSALDYIHTLDRPVIHGEITNENIMINLVGGIEDLKLIDFGHARFLDQRPSKWDIDILNPFYMAPERFNGTCDVRTDIYSVGVLIYHLLYGELPWFVDVSMINSSDKIQAIISKRDEPLQIPEREIYELDEQFVNCMLKALCFDADRRFQSASDFIKAIDGEIVIERQSTRRQILSADQQKDNKETVAPKKNIPKGCGFAAVAGMDELKQKMTDEIIKPIQNPELYRKYGITIPNGMLLYGPPGCGKTFFAKHFAEEVGQNFMCITPATLKSRYVNATQENIAKMFKDAEENAPTIIFIDEINELVPNRSSDVHEMSLSAVNEMLAQMDRTGEKGIFIIGATNYPHMIDPAMLRAGRLEKSYYVGAPDLVARKALFKLYMKDRPYDFGIDYDKLAEMTENYVSADIMLIVNDAARLALEERNRIGMNHLSTIINNTLPSLNEKELKRYEEIRMEMNGVIPNSKKRSKIGFIYEKD